MIRSLTYLSFLSFLFFSGISCSNDISFKEDKYVKQITSVEIISSEKDKQPLQRKNNITFRKRGTAYPQDPSIFINPNKTFQEIEGFGGLISDASLSVINTLSKSQKEELLNAYFSEAGNNYNLLKINIHSSKYSKERYTYIQENDESLASFNIHPDKENRIPFLKEVLRNTDYPVKIYATPWSPPAFMKDNNSMINGGRLHKKYYQHWSDYYVKFIQAYQQEGIDIWGVTLQNEPMRVHKWESCIFTASEEKDFLKNYLGPTFKNNGLEDKKIIVWNQEDNLLAHRAQTIFEDQEANKYAWGIGINREISALNQNDNYILGVYESYPNKKVIQTDAKVLNNENSWESASIYAAQLINDLNQGIVGWTDTNLFNDTSDGECTLSFDQINDELTFTPRYYFLGHFSKYIKEKAKRVSSSVSTSELLSTTFENEGNYTTIVLNTSNNPINYKVVVENKEVRISIEPQEIQTLLF